MSSAWRLAGWVPLVFLLIGCGSGGNGANDSQDIPIQDRGFLTSGIFVGQLPDSTQVLLVLQSPNYFLNAGDLASKGQYSINSIELRGSGVDYTLSPDAEDQVVGNLQLRGEYKSDRHIQLSWQEVATGEERSLIVEGSDLYFKDSPIDNVLGAWLNQNEGNLTFLNISENHAPVAGDDFVAVEPGVETEIPVLANDRDPDGDTIFVSDLDSSSSGGGQLVLDDNGTPDDKSDDRVLYTPPDTLTSGTDTFSYDVQDDQEATDSAVVTLTLPVREADAGLSLQASTLVPDAGERVTVEATLVNNGDVPIQVQAYLKVPNGLVYRNDDGGGAFDADSGFWAISLQAGENETLTVNFVIANKGPYTLSGAVSSMDATDGDASNDQDELEFVPGNLPENPPTPPATAQIEGVILSSLTQITGTIAEAKNGFNAYSLTLDVGSGGLGSGGAQTDPYTGFAVLNEEMVDTSSNSGDSSSGDGSGTDSGSSDTTQELRPTMLIFTANPSGVYLNKLYFVTQEELQNGNQ